MKKNVQTFEELIMSMITEAFEAIHTENEYYFDNTIESIEILFKVVPAMYNDFITEKNRLYVVANENFKSAAQKLSGFDDELYQDFMKRKEESEISWSFRKDILEAILNTLAKYNKISFLNPEFASLESAEITPAPLQSEITNTNEPTFQSQQTPPQPTNQVTLPTPPQPNPIPPTPQVLPSPPVPQTPPIQTQQKQTDTISEDELNKLLEKNKEKQNNKKQSNWSKLFSQQ